MKDLKQAPEKKRFYKKMQEAVTLQVLVFLQTGFLISLFLELDLDKSYTPVESETDLDSESKSPGSQE